MGSGFRLHDCDRTTESMEGVWMGYGPVWKGVGLQLTRGLFGPSVNRWSIKQPPNGTKLDMQATGGVPRPLVKPRAIPRMYNTHSQ